MRFPQVLRRLTGISTPIVGISWEPGEGDVAVGRRALVFLADRRVLYSPYELELPDHCISSIIEIRRFLTGEIGALDSDNDLVPHLEGIRAACRKFLDTVQAMGPNTPGPGNMWGTLGWIFNAALGELRGVTGVHIAQIAARCGLDVPDELDPILPAEASEGDDDSNDDRWWRHD